MLKIALLDDYARVGLRSADWSTVKNQGHEITVFDRHLSEEEAATELASFDVLCTIRERMALPRTLIERLPNLKLITIIGKSLPNMDMDAATEHGIVVSTSDLSRQMSPAMKGVMYATPELAWGLLIATVRHMTYEDRRMREGGWQSTVGIGLYGKTLGLLGLGRIGKRMTEYAKAFGMDVIAWSENLTDEAAQEGGARRVEKDELFSASDIVSIQVQLSERTRGLVGERELSLMRPTAYLINTSRGPIVDEAALVAALTGGRIAGAGLDVYDTEPLPMNHPLRHLNNVTLMPHLGYVTEETMGQFYADTAEAVAAFAAGTPLRVANPEALKSGG